MKILLVMLLITLCFCLGHWMGYNDGQKTTTIALAPVLGKANLDRTIEIFKDSGITEIPLCTALSIMQKRGGVLRPLGKKIVYFDWLKPKLIIDGKTYTANSLIPLGWIARN